MLTQKISEMTRGWFIGDFEPSVLKTKEFEVGVLTHKKGEQCPKHYHKVATEVTLLLSGSMTICGQLIEAGTIFTIEPNEIADPVFHEDCTVLVIKTPSVIGDKYVV